MRQLLSLLFLAIAFVGGSCRRQASVATPSCCAKPPRSSAFSVPAPLTPDASIYQLPGVWLDQHNHSVSLNTLKGKVQVVAMIFTHCGYACPRLVQEMKDIEDSLSASQRAGVGYVLVSFDTRRDDPARLQQYAEEQRLDGHWVLLHGNAEEVRQLSMLLNVSYQPAADGNFNHSNAVVILDRQGTPRQTLEGLSSNAALAIRTIGRLETQ
ncbi:MAG TPA: SCO family protein [Puia sp.]|nr:SCO family protein [Puia sp.]